MTKAAEEGTGAQPQSLLTLRNDKILTAARSTMDTSNKVLQAAIRKQFSE